MYEKLALSAIVVLVLVFATKHSKTTTTTSLQAASNKQSPGAPIIFAEAKGVAGLGKAGGDSQGGSDKAGQQVPPEVYNALSYAGSIFLLILSVPFVCFGLNKLLNKIEDCFGCGPSSRGNKLETVSNIKNMKSRSLKQQQLSQEEHQNNQVSTIGSHQRNRVSKATMNNNHSHSQRSPLQSPEVGNDQLNSLSCYQQNEKHHQSESWDQTARNKLQFLQYDGNSGCNSLNFAAHGPSVNNELTIVNQMHQAQPHSANKISPMAPGAAIQLPFSDYVPTLKPLEDQTI